MKIANAEELNLPLEQQYSFGNIDEKLMLD